MNGLAGKIIKGKFPSVSSQYSKNLRALVNDMLATNPKKRPDIEQILRKSFVQTRVKEFVGDLDADELHRQVCLSCLSGMVIVFFFLVFWLGSIPNPLPMSFGSQGHLARAQSCGTHAIYYRDFASLSLSLYLSFSVISLL